MHEMSHSFAFLSPQQPSSFNFIVAGATLCLLATLIREEDQGSKRMIESVVSDLARAKPHDVNLRFTRFQEKFQGVKDEYLESTINQHEHLSEQERLALSRVSSQIRRHVDEVFFQCRKLEQAASESEDPPKFKLVVLILHSLLLILELSDTSILSL